MKKDETYPITLRRARQTGPSRPEREETLRRVTFLMDSASIADFSQWRQRREIDTEILAGAKTPWKSTVVDWIGILYGAYVYRKAKVATYIVGAQRERQVVKTLALTIIRSIEKEAKTITRDNNGQTQKARSQFKKGAANGVMSAVQRLAADRRRSATQATFTNGKGMALSDHIIRQRLRAQEHASEALRMRKGPRVRCDRSSLYYRNGFIHNVSNNRSLKNGQNEGA